MKLACLALDINLTSSSSIALAAPLASLMSNYSSFLLHSIVVTWVRVRFTFRFLGASMSRIARLIKSFISFFFLLLSFFLLITSYRRGIPQKFSSRYFFLLLSFALQRLAFQQSFSLSHSFHALQKCPHHLNQRPGIVLS